MSLRSYLKQAALDAVCTLLMLAIPFSIATAVGEVLGLTWAMITAVVVYFLQLGIVIRIVK